MNTLWRDWMSRRIPPNDRIQLSHRSIFILPSRAGVGFLALLLVMWLVAINYQSNLALGLVLLLFSLFVVSVGDAYRNLSGLVISRAHNTPVHVGEDAQFRIRLIDERNRAPRESIWAGWSRDEGVGCSLLDGSETDLILTLPALERGWLDAPRVRVWSDYPLGLLHAWSWVDLDQRVLVYPRAVESEWLAEGEGGDDGHVQRLLPGQEEFAGLRDYQVGDSLRQVHWPAFAKGQGMVSKLYGTPPVESDWLDWNDFPAGSTEQRLEALCYWVLTLSQRQQRFGLRLPDGELPPALGDEHLRRALRALALFGTGES